MNIKSLLTISCVAFSSIFMQANAQTDNDLSLSNVISPNINGNLCNGYQELIVRVSNVGRNQVSAFSVQWSLNGVLMGTKNLNTLLTPVNTPNSVLNVNMGLFQLSYGVPATLKVWTANPNGTTDNARNNDTLTAVLTPNDPGIVLNPMPDTVICYNNTLTLDAGYNAYTDYTWSNGTQAQLNTITTPGTHWVWAYSSQGCLAFDTFEVTEIREPDLGNIAIADLGNRSFSFSLSNPISITDVMWDFGDASPLETGMGAKTHQYAQDGTYTLTLTLFNECGSIVRTEEIFVSNVTSIKNSDDLNKAVQLYPNPAKNVINMVYPNKLVTIKAVTLVNALGQQVYYADKNFDNLDISNVANGVYQLVIHSDKGITSKKVTVQK